MIFIFNCNISYDFYLADCQWGQWGEYGQCDRKQCTKSRSRTIRRKADGGIPCQKEDGINSTACPCEDSSKLKGKKFWSAKTHTTTTMYNHDNQHTRQD